MGERDAAQADELIRALCEVRYEMIRQLRWLQDSHLAVPATSVSAPINAPARLRMSAAKTWACASRAASSAVVRLVRVSATDKSSPTVKPALWASSTA